jgi:hypothetical protein
MESLQEHLKQFSAVSINVEPAADALKQNLRKYGPVHRTIIDSFDNALRFLLPIKSFTIRFLLLELHGWTLLLTDMRGENSYVDAYAISTFSDAATADLNDLAFAIDNAVSSPLVPAEVKDVLLKLKKYLASK